MDHSIPIIIYHQITNTPHNSFIKYSVTPKTFGFQMKLLRLMGYNTISLDDLLNYRNGQTVLPSNPIIITFDDGLNDCIRYAVPELEKHGFTGLFYIPTNFIGKKSSWMKELIGEEFNLTDLNTIIDLDSKGFQIGSHSLNHPFLAKLDEQQCYEELTKSRKFLEDLLGHEIIHFAYPNGSYDERVRKLAGKAGYRTCTTMDPGYATMKKDLLALPRINIRGDENLVDFISKLKTSRNVKKNLISKVSKIKKLFHLNN